MTTQQPTPYDAEIQWTQNGELELRLRLTYKQEGYRRAKAEDADLLATAEQALRIFGGHSGAESDPKTSIEVEQGFNVLDRLKKAIAKAKGGV